MTVDGPGTYTLSLDFSGVKDGEIPGVAFMAVGIANGEATFPGYFIDITEVKVNGEAIELGKDFTTTDDGIVTRSNIWNEWVTDIPAEARVADGDLEGVTAKIATAEALSGIKTIDVTFDYIYGVPPVVETEQPLTEDEVKELTSKTYGAYIAVQSDPNYIFRNDWEEPSYGRDADNDVFTKLAKTNNDGTITDYGATFEDAVISGNGTYTCSMTTGDMGFGEDTAFHFFRVSTDIPSKLVKEGYVTISDVTIKIGEGKDAVRCCGGYLRRLGEADCRGQLQQHQGGWRCADRARPEHHDGLYLHGVRSGGVILHYFPLARSSASAEERATGIPV